MNIVEAFQEVIGGVWVRRASRVILHSGNLADITYLHQEYQYVQEQLGKGRVLFHSVPNWRKALIPKGRRGSKTTDLIREVTLNTTWIQPVPKDDGWYGDLKTVLRENKSNLRVVNFGHLSTDAVIAGMVGIEMDTVADCLSSATLVMAQELVRLGRNEGQRVIFLLPGDDDFLNQLKTEIDREWVEMSVRST